MVTLGLQGQRVWPLAVLLGVLGTGARARAEPPTVADVRVVTSATGAAAAVEVYVAGGRAPLEGLLQVAPPGADYTRVTLVPGDQPGLLRAALPPALGAGPLVYFVSVKDADGLMASQGSAVEPLRFAPAQPPAPVAPPAAADLPPALPDQGAESALPPPAAAPHPPAGTAPPPAPSTAPQKPAVKTRQVVEVFGIPIFGGRVNPLLTAGAAAAGVGSLVAGAASFIFLVDLARAWSMVSALNTAEKNDYARPSKCSDWKGCRQPYEQAMYADGVVVVLGGLTTVGLLASAVGLALAAAVMSRE